MGILALTARAVCGKGIESLMRQQSAGATLPGPLM
jgi:hypothetical protein